MKCAVIVIVALCCAATTHAVTQRPHLFFVEGSLGGTASAALSRESEVISEHGSFYWSYNGNHYRYRPGQLALTAGLGYEFMAFEWLGLRGLYSYSSHLHLMTASTGTGKYRRTSSLGGQVAETTGYFVGPVFRYTISEFSWFTLEFPLQWGIHSGHYTPLRAYTAIRDFSPRLPQRAEEYTRQDFRQNKIRYGVGLAFARPDFPLYASLTFCVEQGLTRTAIGAQPTMPAGSSWNTYLVIFALGWRV